MWEDHVLMEVAKLERRYHDSTQGFITPKDAIWQWPALDPFEVLCRNDFAPYNIIFRGNQPAGIIDFDMASPGPRLWDLAYTAYRFVPLTAPENPDTPISAATEQLRRLNVFCAAYGMDVQAPSVLNYTVKRLNDLIDSIVTQAAAGDPAQQRVLERGDVGIYKADRAYIQENLIQAVIGR